MRREQRVRAREQARCGRARAIRARSVLHPEDIRCIAAEVPALQRGEDGALVHEGSAGLVHEECTRTDMGQRRVVDDVGRRGGWRAGLGLAAAGLGIATGAALASGYP